MPNHQILDAIRGVLPRLGGSSFQLQPSEKTAVTDHENYLPIFPYSLHSHPFFEWMWCVENHAFIQVEEQVYRLEAGDFCLLPPGQLHMDVYTPALKSYRIMVCSFRDETIYASINTYVPINHLQYDSMIFAPAPPFTSELLSALQQESKSKQSHRGAVCSALVSALGHLMLRAFESPFPHPERKRFPGKISQRVDNYLNQHFNQSLALADVACALRISRNYLATLYKQETGKTIGQALTEIRLEYAKKLLLESHLSVQEVATAVGYSGPEHFSRVFLRHAGSTPGRFVKYHDLMNRKKSQ
jgi:AraC-like DNA-binding protein